MTERVAVVCVHGVAPHPRYEFQDQVSSLLRDRLNERDGTQDKWSVEVVNPENVLAPGVDDPWPTVSKVSGGDATYDVTEAYWSPLDKDATNSFLVLAWLFRTVFVPLNTVARIQAPFLKQVFDYGFIGSALFIAFAFFGGSLAALWLSLNRLLDITGLFRQTSVSETISALNTSVASPGGPPISLVWWLFVGIIGAFLLGQAIAAIFSTLKHLKLLWQNRISISHRVVPILVLIGTGTFLMVTMARARFIHGYLGWDGVLFLVAIFVAFQIGRGLLVSFIVEFFGDVQIYTTRDENESRFFGLRDEIMDTAVTAIIRAVSPRLNGGRVYDRVIVLAHSLGATIATDAITRLKQAMEQGSLTPEEFGRIRAFIMLGSSLEKTNYFFTVAGADASVSLEAWHGGAYESIFDDAPPLIKGAHDDKIFWVNYWYFQDPICNEVQSYEDFCRNEEGSRHIDPLRMRWLLHSDYLYDPWFWFSSNGHLGALDVITGAGATAKET